MKASRPLGETVGKDVPAEDRYQQLILDAQLADYSPVRGCMVIRPYGYKIWENIQRVLDQRIKETGHENAYFPLFIPESFLKKEKEHVEGFSPELAIVTEAGGKKLSERLVVRPTSETVMYDVFSHWIHSWRDLPLLINQWANVVRWEMRTRLFLRTTEFLWQEGHTAHATEAEAEAEARRMLDVYLKFVQEYLALSPVAGVKSESEKFAGAARTYTLELMTRDKKALQAGTSHNLGQNFAKVFGIKFVDQKQQEKYVWQTSWGVSTRLIGGLVLTHNDKKGLLMPPRIAPIQIVIVPIYKTDEQKKAVLGQAKKLEVMLKQFAVKVDEREELTPGFKFNDWELKGVPLRLEIGPRDLMANQVMLVRRDTGQKEAVKVGEVAASAEKILDEIQAGLLAASKKFREANTHEARSYSELKEFLEKKGGFVRAHWCQGSACEQKVKAETKGTIRCFSLDDKETAGECIVCGQAVRSRPVIWAKAY